MSEEPSPVPYFKRDLPKVSGYGVGTFAGGSGIYLRLFACLFLSFPTFESLRKGFSGSSQATGNSNLNRNFELCGLNCQYASLLHKLLIHLQPILSLLSSIEVQIFPT